MSEEEKDALRESAARAKRERKEARERAEEARRMGFQALLGQRMEAKADALAKKLEEHALSDDPAISLRGLQLWVERVYGKAVQTTQDLSPELPSEVAALHSMPPEERRALLRSLSTPPAH